ncbi:MAG: DUF1735 domain-containing protein [Agriterribacter sp.]
MRAFRSGGPTTPAGGQAYIGLPDDAFQLQSLELTIPKGSLQAGIPVTVFPGMLTTTEKYMLAFSIADANGYTIASNFGTMIFTIVVQ